MMKKLSFLFLLLLMLCLCCCCLADSLPLDGAAPYPPVEGALSEDGLSYDDGTLSVRVVQDVAFDTKVYYVFVTVTDPSQLRTALAAPHPSTKRDYAVNIAQRSNAVLAVSGDFYSYHKEGIVYRQGQKLRHNPRAGRDTLIIDAKGDFNIIAPTSADAVDNFPGEIREAFCFGPGLVIDGVVQEFDYKKKTSCGYPTKAQRMVYCQLDSLSYLFLATEGPEQDQPGLSVPEALSLVLPYNPRQVYNMDGGNSTSVILCGRKINAPDAKTRYIGDIVYFATLVGE